LAAKQTLWGAGGGGVAFLSCGLGDISVFDTGSDVAIGEASI